MVATITFGRRRIEAGCLRIRSNILMPISERRDSFMGSMMLLVDAPSLTSTVTLRAVTNSSEWDRLYKKVARPYLVQNPAYVHAKQQSEHWRVKRVVFECQGAPLAICHVLQKQLFGLPLLSRINRGPMFMDSSPDGATISAVFAALRTRWRFFKGGILSIAPALGRTPENNELLSGLGLRDLGKPGWCSSVVSLQPDVDTLRRNLDRKWRHDLKTSERSGLTVRISQSTADFEWLLEEHRQHMIRKRFRGLSPEFLRAYRSYNPDNVLIFLAICKDAPVAGFAVTRSAGIAEGLILCCDGGREFNAGNSLLWNAAIEMKDRGCDEYDLGGHGNTPGKYKHFKEGMDGSEYQLMGEWLSL
jgi:lipid II:glycine glycyltransferase (peptidoglycan interpeptide bridge formation enzyme)